MLDIKFIRENTEKVKASLQKRGVDFDMAALLAADEKRRAAITEGDGLRARQNEFAEEIARSPAGERAEKIAASRDLKARLAAVDKEMAKAEEEFMRMMRQLPNIPLSETEQDEVLREVGTKPQFNFVPRDHMEIAIQLDLIDIERAAKVSGSRFAYLKNEAALLEFALISLAMKIATQEGFIPIIPPVLIAEGATENLGYWDDEEGRENYFLVRDTRCYACRHYLGGLEGKEVFCRECRRTIEQKITADERMKCHNCGRESRLTWFYLAGTAEHAIVPMHQNEIFAASELPRRYVGFSTAFRREAGTYGKDTRGVMRVHQFDKVELISFVHPAKSKDELQYLLGLEEKLWQTLGIPYRVVHLGTKDIAKPSAVTYDIEAWLPGQREYREVSSASNTTDFQARRLKTQFRNKEGRNEFVHILNATGFAIGRTLIAILENYQQADGSVAIPEVLQPYMGGMRFIK
ncbi:MAG: serine--tRNA ligase [Patescibacteria group bacterium]